MKYIDAIQKFAKNIMPRLDQEEFFIRDYSTVIFTISQLFDRSYTETEHDLGVYTRIYRDQKSGSWVPKQEKE